jgi:HSP20 family protein
MESEDTEENVHRLETHCGAFSGSVELPADVDSEKVKAVYKKGVLKLTLPKKGDQSAKKIEIKKG